MGGTARAVVGGLSRTIQRVELRWGPDLRVDPLSPSTAVVASSYHEVRTGTDGSRVEEDGYFTAVAERRGERWEFRDAHWSVAAPAAATAAALGELARYFDHGAAHE